MRQQNRELKAMEMAAGFGTLAASYIKTDLNEQLIVNMARKAAHWAAVVQEISPIADGEDFIDRFVRQCVVEL